MTQGRKPKIPYTKGRFELELAMRSPQDIADEHGVSLTTVYHTMKRLGVTPPRERSRIESIPYDLWVRVCRIVTTEEMCILTGENERAVMRRAAQCKRYPINKHQEALIPSREELMELRYGKRMLMSEIAEYYDYTNGAITSWFRYHDIPKWNNREIATLRRLTNKVENSKTSMRKKYYERKLDEFWEDIGARHGYVPGAATCPRKRERAEAECV